MSENMFGAKGRYGGYTPMSEDEQEVLERLCATRDMVVTIKDWGFIQGPAAKFGDLRLQIPLSITFDRPLPPNPPIPVYHFDLELHTGSGIFLFAKRMSTVYAGHPIYVGAGTHIDMIWDIGIKHMDPKLVRALKPGAVGLTSRWQDRDTGDMTLLGNTRLRENEKKALRTIRTGEALVREWDRKKVAGKK